MKKLLIPLFSLFFLYSPSVFADDISDFQIEGISIGDSLLDYMTKDEILEGIERTKNLYLYLNEPNKYSAVYLTGEFLNYDYLGVFVKNNSGNAYVTNKNTKYTIVGIVGDRTYIEDFDKCLKKRDEIAEIFSNMLPNAEKSEAGTIKHNADSSGNSIIDQITFWVKSGNLSVYCDNFEETFRIKNNYPEGLSIVLRSVELNDWLNDSK